MRESLHLADERRELLLPRQSHCPGQDLRRFNLFNFQVYHRWPNGRKYQYEKFKEIKAI